jgi:hypothetical protein
MSFMPGMMLAATILVGAAPDPLVTAGIVAFDRGDFGTAFAILRPLVYEAPRDFQRPALPDPLALAYLGQMLRRGDAAPADWPLACALFRLALHAAAERWPPSQSPHIPFATDGIMSVCLPETRSEVEALMSTGLQDGVTRQEFVFDDGGTAVFDRRGFHLDFQGEHRDINLRAVRLGEVALGLSEAKLSVTDERGRHRHLLELFKWSSHFDSTEAHFVRELHWMVFDVREASVATAIDETLLTVRGGPYPSADLPEGVREAAVLRVTGRYDVEWLWRGTPDKGGILRR